MTADDDDFGPHMPGVFDFTILFEQSILSLLPSVLFVLLMSWRVAYLHRRPQRVSAGPLLWVKMAAVVVYACLQIAYAVHLILDKAPRTRTTITEAVIALVETIAVGLLSYTEHCKSTKPSALLSAYFVVTTVLDIALARTFWIRPRVRETAGIFTATLAVKTVLLCLEEIPKRRTVEGTATSRETSAGAINRTVFWWLNRLFYKGYRQVLRIEDLDDINEKLDSAKLLGQLEAIWYKERSDSPNSLLVCTLKAHKWQLLATVPPRLLSSGFMYAQPFLIDSVIRQIAMPAADMTAQVSSGLIGATLLVYVGLAATDVWYKHLSFQLVTMCRGGLVSLMFDKTLRLKTATIKDAAPVTLMTTDMDVIAGAGETLTEFWASLVDLPIGIYLLYRQVGYPGLFVLLPTVAMLVLSAVIAPAMEPATAQWNEAVQKRVGETANMLAQMKSIKMMGLTQYLHSRIHELRIDEIKVSEKLRWLMVHMYTLSVLSGVVTPMIVILSSIYWTKSGQGLSVAEAFTSLSIIVLVSQPLVMMLVSLMQIAGVFGSFSRIQAFLQLPEQKVQCHTGMDGEKTQVKHQVVSKDATPVGILSSRNMPTPEMGQPDRVLLMSEATFTSDEGMHLLTDISLAVHRGTLNMFTGKVGCGKSSLLKAIIGELVPESGSVCLAADSIAYCDQTPWLRNGTIRNNIIGQSSLDEERLTRAIHACALDQDVDSLPQGDLTIVGTGGITLSGGQKQRVALARAVYAQKSLVVLDDVFSGLDNTTARLVFNRLLEVDGVLRQDGTTVILATSNADFVPAADCITMLETGRITHNQVSYESVEPSTWGAIQVSQESGVEDENSMRQSSGQVVNNPLQSQAPLVTETDFARQTGDTECYKIYLGSWGWRIVTVVLALSVANAAMEVMPQVWMKLWVQDGTAGKDTGYAVGFAGFSLLSAVLSTLAFSVFIIVGMPKSSIRLHLDLLNSITRAPLYFFTTTDSGNILNRFSQDMTLIDQTLPAEFLATLLLGLKAVAQTGVVASGASYVGAAIPLCLLVLWVIQRFYLRTSRQLRFLDLEAKTPLYTQFTEMLSGLATIRAFGWSPAFLADSVRLLDTSQKPFYTMFCVQRWLGVVLDLFVAGMAVVLVTAALRATGTTSQGAIGLAMVNLIGFNQTLSLFLDSWTKLETSLGAIARLKWVTNNVPNENKQGENGVPESDWPLRGAVTFDNVTASYSDTMEPVLRNISIDIKPGQKVGVCGRSGSGKSSLVLALLRLLELKSGTIRIDGVDLSTLSREHIRTHITTIPQDPVKLTGSVRQNLDPRSHVQSEDLLIQALRKTNIWDIVEPRGGLDADLGDLGLSVGQQQLFCLARALLLRNSIVLLDEATSSVDRNTDREIRRIVAEEMSKRTVVEVAHKLDVIRDFDVVIVMGDGAVVEIGNPDELLAKPSALRTLWDHQGL